MRDCVNQDRFKTSFLKIGRNRSRFFKNIPDENLVRYVEQGWISPGEVLDFGTGPGRNAIYLATHDFSVTRLDLSATALDWAT